MPLGSFYPFVLRFVVVSESAHVNYCGCTGVQKIVSAFRHPAQGKRDIGNFKAKTCRQLQLQSLLF